MSEPNKEEIEIVAKCMHDAYEESAIKHGWKTQAQCQVSYYDLPEENKLTMYDSAIAAIASLKKLGYVSIDELIEKSENYIYVLEHQNIVAKWLKAQKKEMEEG